MLSLLANRRREPQDPKVEIDSRSVRRIIGGLRGGSGSMFRLGDLHMEPPSTQSPCFVYLQADNDMYMWNHVICTYRRNLVDSLQRGMPTVVDESVEVRMRKLDGDTECKRQRLDRFGPSA